MLNDSFGPSKKICPIKDPSQCDSIINDNLFDSIQLYLMKAYKC